MIDWSDLSPAPDGLVVAVVQDRDGLVRMVGYVSEESWAATMKSGLVTFWSRSRSRLWQKGEESGNVLHLLDAAVDCDGDALLLTVDPVGPTCHTGETTCFTRDGSPRSRSDGTRSARAEREGGRFRFLDTLWSIIESRAQERPEGSYTTSLIEGGPDTTGRKVVEEATEVLVAAKNHAAGIDDDQRLAEEAADLVYHLLVTLAERGVEPALVTAELAARHAR